MQIRRAFAVTTLALFLAGGAAVVRAQDQDHHDNSHYVHHPEWKKGYHMDHDNWNRGDQVDWHAHHLRKPPAGYEWRMIDGNYVCANSDGVVFSVVVGH